MSVDSNPVLACGTLQMLADVLAFTVLFSQIESYIVNTGDNGTDCDNVDW